MRKGTMRDGVKYGSKNAFLREAVAYAVGRTEEWTRQFAEGHGLPFEEVASGISSALAIQGDRSYLRLPELRGNAAAVPEVLQPKVAVGRRTRKPVFKAARKKRRLMNGHTILAIQSRTRKGQRRSQIAHDLGISLSTVYRHQKAA